MKKIALTSVLVLLLPLLTACKDEPANPPREYGGALIDSYDDARDAAASANLDVLKSAIRQYRAANGGYPASLEELKGFIGTEFDEEKYEYDPGTGTLTLR